MIPQPLQDQISLEDLIKVAPLDEVFVVPGPQVAGYRASWIAQNYPDLLELWTRDPVLAELVIDEAEIELNQFKKTYDSLPWHDWTPAQWKDSFSPKKKFEGAETAAEIKARVDVSKIVSRYTKLIKRSDTSSVGLCPLHDEKTPSFNFNKTKGLFHCFGCGASGDVISLVMKKEKCDFRTALGYCSKWG